MVTASIFLLGTLSFMVLRSGGNSTPLWLDPVWQSVLQERTPFLFLENWKLQEWLSLVTYLLLGFIGWSIRPRNTQTTTLSIFVLSMVLLLTIIVFISADWLGFVPILQLQLARSWQLIVILALIFGADLVYYLYQQQNWPYSFSAILLAVIIYCDQGRNMVWSLAILILLLGIILIIHLLVKNRFQDRHWVKRIVLVSYLVTVTFTIVALAITQGSFSSITLTLWQTLVTAIGSTFLIVGVLYILKALLQQIYPKHRNLYLLGGEISLLIALLLLSQTWSGREWFTNSINNLQLPFLETWRTTEYRAWQDVQIWAETNTAIDARFATSPNNEGFRVLSKRSPIAEAKDGAPSLYTRAYAIEWKHRMQTLLVAESCLKERQKIDCLESLYESYPFEYAVVPLQQAMVLSLELPIVYKNEGYVVYAWVAQ